MILKLQYFIIDVLLNIFKIMFTSKYISFTI